MPRVTSAELSRNVTLPVGVPPPPVASTIAVNVTDCAKDAGFSEETTEVDVGLTVTVCTNGPDVLLPKLALPIYCAVMGCVATLRVDVLNVATPLLNVPEPIKTLLSRKFTVPVGIPPPELVTLAVNCTD
jgi:hypothetical protein